MVVDLLLAAAVELGAKVDDDDGTAVLLSHTLIGAGVGLALTLTRGSICKMSTSGSLINVVIKK